MRGSDGDVVCCDVSFYVQCCSICECNTFCTRAYSASAWVMRSATCSMASLRPSSSISLQYPARFSAPSWALLDLRECAERVKSVTLCCSND